MNVPETMNEVLDMSDDEGKVLLNSIFKVILLMYKYQGKTCLCNLKRDKFFKISAWVTFAFVAGISEYFSTVLSLLDFPLFFFLLSMKDFVLLLLLLSNSEEKTCCCFSTSMFICLFFI